MLADRLSVKEIGNSRHGLLNLRVDKIGSSTFQARIPLFLP